MRSAEMDVDLRTSFAGGAAGATDVIGTHAPDHVFEHGHADDWQPRGTSRTKSRRWLGPALAASHPCYRQRHALHYLSARGTAILPGMIKRVFQPAPMAERFDRLFPEPLMLRPLQLLAAAEDAALMTPTAMELERRY